MDIYIGRKGVEGGIIYFWGVGRGAEDECDGVFGFFFFSILFGPVL